MMIYAEGIKDNHPLTVVYSKGEFLFNGKEDEFYQFEMEKLLKRGYAVGGTFYPEEKDLRNVLNVMENHFFDKNVKAQIVNEKIEEIPYEDGVVY